MRGRSFFFEHELRTKAVTRVDASGENAFFSKDAGDFLFAKPSLRERVRIIRRYADGTVTQGPHPTGSLGWDGLVAEVPVVLSTHLDLARWFTQAEAKIRSNPAYRWEILEFGAAFSDPRIVDRQSFRAKLTVEDLLQTLNAAGEPGGPGMPHDGVLKGLLKVAYTSA